MRYASRVSAGTGGVAVIRTLISTGPAPEAGGSRSGTTRALGEAEGAPRSAGDCPGAIW
jgi:hypothetical protein